MKNFTQKFIGLLALIFAMTFNTNAQDNYSMSFSENDGIFIEPIFDGVQNDFSISATVKPNGSETWGSIFLSRSHFNDTYLNIQKYPLDTSITKVRFFASYLQNINSNNEAQLWGDVDLNQWNNIVGTYNGETIKLYVNGELVDSSPAYGQVDWSPNCWTSIGGDGNYSADNCSGGYTSMEGNINNLHIWNKSLSQSEIQNYINCPPSGNEEGLVGYWGFNEGSGDTVLDLSGYGNHGILNGATYSEDVPEQNCNILDNTSNYDIIEGLTDDLIAHYPFNGNANDESVNNLNGVVNNATLTSDRFGNENSAYLFNSDFPSYIQLPELSSEIGAPNGSTSISLWFLDEGSASQNGILFHSSTSYPSSYILGRVEVCKNEDKVKVYHRNPSTNNEPSSNVELNSEWNHIVIVIDGNEGEYSFYLNGNKINDMSFSFNPNESYYTESRTWQIGARTQDQSYHQFIGSIDDIRVWDRVILEEEISELYEISENTPIGVNGCMDSLACNYNPEANMADGSCEYAEQGYDCDGNINVQVGDEAFGGIVFYVDETGQHGLVAAMEDIGLNNFMIPEYCPLPPVFNTGTAIGSGYENTLEIDALCAVSNIAASNALQYENNGFNDWYLPSKDELIEMYSIGDYNFSGWYWSSSISYLLSSQSGDYNNWGNVFCFDFSGGDGDYGHTVAGDIYNVRPIRAFGYTLGCMDSLACNFNPEANMADGNCEYPEQGYDCDGNITEYVVGMEAEGGIVFYVDDTGTRGLVAAMEDLEEDYEWGCYGTSISGADGQAIGLGYQNTLDIVAGCSETPIAASEALAYESEGYSDWYLPSRDELVEMYDSIGSCNSNIGGFSNYCENDALDGWYWSSSEYDDNYAFFDRLDVDRANKGAPHRVRVIRAFGYTLGCMDSLACNYNPEANMADGSCEYSDEGYDCEGNINVQVGDEAFGGIVFYIGDGGQHGLVASNEDIAVVPFGCYGEGNIEGADGIEIGTGYQNTLDIVSGCSETPIGASLALAFEANDFDDWYIPSQNELNLMYTTIGNSSSGNIGEFIDGYYWSSTQYGSGSGYDLDFTNGVACDNCYDNNYANRSRPIRAFGNWTMGCMDSLACNFNPEANMADGSCEYSDLGYDCEGNFTEYVVGMEAEGGIVFYVDDTGTRGLVAAMEDLEEDYEWGCYGTSISGADGQAIGLGYQNTLDIVAGCSETPIAASEALAYESEGYSDWYLPSKDELEEMYNTIGNQYFSDSVDVFGENWYRSSSEYDSGSAWSLNFENNHLHYVSKNNIMNNIRPIRAFGNWITGCMNIMSYNYNVEAQFSDSSCLSYEEFLIDSLQQALSVFETVEDGQNYSMSFDGSTLNGSNHTSILNDHYIEVNNFNHDFQTNFTIATWVYKSGDGGELLQRRDQNNIDFVFGFNSSDLININLGNIGTVVSNTVIPENEWHYVAATYNGESIKLFIDGVLENETNAVGNISINSSYLTIGKYTYYGGYTHYYFYQGGLDQLVIWDQTLSQEEIHSYMSCPPSGNEEGLISYWNFNESSGDTVYDISGNGNHGIIYGAEFSEDVPESYNGCTDENALNFDAEALCDNGSCVFGDEVVSDLEEDLSVFETVEEEQDYSMSFDGIDDYVEINTEQLNNFSLTASFNLSSIDNGYSQSIIQHKANCSRGGGYIIGEDNGYLRWVKQWCGECSSSSCGNAVNHTNIIEIQANQWYDLALVSNGFDKQILYLNGNAVDSIENPNSFEVYGVQPITIGKWHDGNTVEHSNIKINNVSYFDFELTSDQIQSYISCAPSGSEEGLVGYWNFNVGSGDTVYDLSGNGNHGVINGAEFSEDVPESYNGCTDANALNFDESALCDNGSCVYGDEVVASLEDENSDLEQDLSVFETIEEVQDYSMSFDGNNYLDLGSSMLLNNLSSGVFSFQFKLLYNQMYSLGCDGDESEYISLIRNESNYNVMIKNGKLCVELSTSDAYLQALSHLELDMDQWHEISIVYNNDSFSFYINGIEDSVSIGNTSYNPNLTSNLLVGNAINTYCQGLNGNIDGIRIWNKSLTQEQIQSYMSCSPSGDEEGLVGYWNFNESSGDTIYDLSGNENHGVIYGAEFSEDVPESYNGCTDENALNFDAEALCDNGSCVYGDEVVASLEDENSDLEESFNQTVSALNNDLDSTNSTLNEVIDTWQSSIDLTTSTLGEVSLINQTLNSFNTAIDLSEGWNMIGYGCPEPIDFEVGLSNYTESVIIAKDNNGDAYLTEWNFNGIGDFTPGFGYQLKISESIEGFSLCGDFTAIDNTQITTIEDNNAQMQNDINCLTGNPEIGDYCYGGIVFYVDETGEHGLVAAMEDLEGTYEWGCYGEIIEGADGTAIGDGYQNSLDIIAGCSQSPIAASEVLDYQFNGFGDWYLPSKDELIEMYNSIGNGSTEGNIGGFETDNNTYYWSSLEADDIHAWGVRFSNGYINDEGKASPGRVRAIRDFGNWTKGCMDETACNFNPEVNMANGSCEYAQEGYDCFGNVIFKSLMFGSNNSDGVIDNFVEVNNVGSQFDLKVGFAISAWVKVLDNHNSLWGCVLGAHNSNGWIFYAGSNSNEGKISFERSGCPSIDGQTDIRDNEWHHISLVITEESIIIYLDGEIETIAPNDECYPTITNSDSSISIGESNHNHSSIENFPGLISDIIVWDLNTNNYDINFIMDYQNYNNFNLKISHWNFNQLNSDTIFDVSGNEYHGTVNGNVQFSHDSH